MLLLAGCAGVDAMSPTPPATPEGPALTLLPGPELRGAARVTVTGTGFDQSKGIYVAFCVQPEPGEPPTPCGGGVDTTGSTSASAWISSNPPAYGKDLASQYGPGGSFEVPLLVRPRIGDVDCREVVCGIATRADHTRSTDRSQDVFIPITFKENQ